MRPALGRCLAMLAPLWLLACGAPDLTDYPPPPAATPAEAATAEARPVEVAFPAFRDYKPHPWDGRAPRDYAVHGIDASRWQGDIDWAWVRESGISFAYLKATEGGDHVDPAFPKHWEGAARAGVPRGAYHFFYFCRPAEEQARWFIRHVPRDPAALPPVLDMEWNHRSPTCRLRPDPATVRAEARRFLDILTAHYGQRPVIYTTIDFYRETGIGTLPNTEFWLRSVAGHPSTVYPGQRWTFWQYTGTGVVPGIQGPVDINVFAGSVADWRPGGPDARSRCRDRGTVACEDPRAHPTDNPNRTHAQDQTMKRPMLAALLASALAAPSAQADTADGAALIGQDWEAIVEEARGGEVNWFMWGGADNINAYVIGLRRRHPEGRLRHHAEPGADHRHGRGR